MDAAFVTLLTAAVGLIGACIGSFGTLVVTWLTKHYEEKKARRELLVKTDFDFTIRFGIRNEVGRGYFKRLVSVAAQARIFKVAGSDSESFDAVDQAFFKEEILKPITYLRTRYFKIRLNLYLSANFNI